MLDNEATTFDVLSLLVEIVAESKEPETLTKLRPAEDEIPEAPEKLEPRMVPSTIAIVALVTGVIVDISVLVLPPITG